MAVLKTTSPTVVPCAPMERPRNTDPSASTSTAAAVLAVMLATERSGCEKRERLSAPPASLKGGLYASRAACASVTSRRARALLPQAKHVRHVVHACGPLPQPLRRADRAACVGHAALRA